jgi:hypothetical protein
VRHGLLQCQSTCARQDENIGGVKQRIEGRAVARAEELGGRIDLRGQCFQRGAFGAVTDDPQRGLQSGGQRGAGAQQEIDALAGLQAADKQQRGAFMGK